MGLKLNFVIVLLISSTYSVPNILESNLPMQLAKPEWKPDFGPAEFVPSWGATVAGARSFLIAYNVNLLATKQQAHRIALLVREKGRDQVSILECAGRLLVTYSNAAYNHSDPVTT